MDKNDLDIIAYLFPVEGRGRDGALEVIQDIHNQSRLIPASRNVSKPTNKSEEARSVREATREPEEQVGFEYEPCLVIRFSNPPRNSRGLIVGRDPKADIVIPEETGVSWHHFALTFDERKCLVVRDLNSTCGTKLIYDGHEGPRGHGVVWSTSAPRLAKDKAPIINVTEGIQFKLILQDHEETSKTYLDAVDRFLQGTAPPEDLLSGLNVLSRVSTNPTTTGQALQSGHRADPILWRKEIGHGTFGVVSYVWNVTTREEFALKEPRLGVSSAEDWKKEAETMRYLSHLYFEYAPEGSLAEFGPMRLLTGKLTRQVAIQLLDALSYLHGHDPPLAHRDIKPANVLVQYWSLDRIHIKLADFGLSKQSDSLVTRCGTELYAAPEVFSRERKRNKYDTSIDVWSLSVLLLKLECHGLPKFEESDTDWGNTLIDFALKRISEQGANDLLFLLVEDMLVIDPKDRKSAEKCYQKALQLFTEYPISQSTNLAVSKGVLPLDSISYLQNSTDSEATTIRPLPNIDAGQSDSRQSHANQPHTSQSQSHSKRSYAVLQGSSESDETTAISEITSEEDEISDSDELDPELQQPHTASLIAALGEDGSDKIDELIGMAPSDMSEFNNASLSDKSDDEARQWQAQRKRRRSDKFSYASK